MTTASPEPAGSVSKIECLATVQGRGEAKISLFRHLAPLTVNAVVRILPLDSRVNLQPAMISLFTELRVGVEKPRAQLTRGDVAFLASGSLVCIFLRDVKSDRPLNPLGKVESGLEIFEGMRTGEVVHLSLAAPQGAEGAFPGADGGSGSGPPAASA
jgi:hypothetical protein